MKTLGLRFTINGRTEAIEVRASSSMLDVIRDQLDLTGAKRSCDVGVCGTCTILLDGRPVSACTTLAAEMDSRHSHDRGPRRRRFGPWNPP